MKWYLVSGQKKILLTDGKTFGRSDYADERRLSRQHFQVELLDDRVLILDLGSTNGTFINERRLPLNVAVELRPGQTVRIGETNFELMDSAGLPSPIRHYGWVLGAVFAMLFGFWLRAPEMDYGRSLSWSGLSILGAMLIVPFIYCSIAAIVLTFKTTALHNRPFTFGVIVLVSTLAFNSLFVWVAFSQTAFPVQIAQQKIEHFCAEKFDWEKCIEYINRCPRCASEMEAGTKLQIAETLKAMRLRYPKTESRTPAAKSK
jgi:hypothetical protein